MRRVFDHPKAGLAAGLDEAYIASHSEQQSLKAVDRKRVGSFMVAALDLDAPGSAGAGTVNTEMLVAVNDLEWRLTA
jgi:hypothetical protein